jgi:transposase
MRAVHQSALALLTRSKKYSGIRVWGLGIAKRRGLRRAAVAVARKLAVLMHRVWLTGPNIAGGERQPSRHER